MKKVFIFLFTFILMFVPIYAASIQDAYLKQLNTLKNSTTSLGTRRYVNQSNSTSLVTEIQSMIAYTDELYGSAKRDLPESTSPENIFQSLYLITILYYKSALQELLLYDDKANSLDQFNSAEAFFKFRYLADRNVYELNEFFKS